MGPNGNKRARIVILLYPALGCMQIQGLAPRGVQRSHHASLLHSLFLAIMTRTRIIGTARPGDLS